MSTTLWFVHRFFDPGSVTLGENNPVITNVSAVTNLSSVSQLIEGNFVIDNAGPTTIPNIYQAHNILA